MVQKLADYVISHNFEHLQVCPMAPTAYRQNKSIKYVLFFREIVQKTAETIAKWMSVGFAHGLFNKNATVKL
jgi:uncharacterized protein YdiU (UPF0061 family)